MQEKSMTELLDLAGMKSLFEKPEQVKVKEIEKSNRESLPVLPKNVHAPDAEELEQIRQYMILYKKENPTASRRAVS